MLVAQSCLTLCDPMDCSPPVSSVHGIFQARILEWGLPFLLPQDLPNPGIKPVSLPSPALQADSLPQSHSGRGSTNLKISLVILIKKKRARKENYQYQKWKTDYHYRSETDKLVSRANRTKGLFGRSKYGFYISYFKRCEKERRKEEGKKGTKQRKEKMCSRGRPFMAYKSWSIYYLPFTEKFCWPLINVKDVKK